MNRAFKKLKALSLKRCMVKLTKHQINKLYQKDNDMFNDIYEQTHKAIYALIFSYTHSSESAKDLMQEAYMKMLEKINSYQPGRSIFSWFMQLAKNHTIDYLRREKKWVKNEPMILNEKAYEPSTDDQSKVMMLVQSLDFESRQIVLLKAVEDVTFKDIAKTLNMKIGTVQWKYYEAIKTIERSLTYE